MEALFFNFSSILLILFAATMFGCSATQSGGDVQGLSLVSGDGQAGFVETALPAPIVVQVHSANGVPLPNVSVYAQVTSGGGSVSSQNLVSDANGNVSAQWVLGRALATDKISFILDSNLWSSNQQAVNVSAKRMLGTVSTTTSNITVAASAVADGVSKLKVKVTLLDANNQPAVGTVPSISLSGTNTYQTCSPADTYGISTCEVLSTEAGTKAMLITSPIYFEGGNAVFVPGPAASFTLVSYVNNLLTVLVKDAFGNLIHNEQVNWAFSVGAGTMGSGASTNTDINGVSTNLLIPSASGLLTVSASLPGTTLPPVTFSFDFGVWLFNSVSLGTTTLGTNVDFSSANFAELTTFNPPENASSFFTAGTANGVTFGTLADGSSQGFKLGAASNVVCDGSLTNCTSEMDSTWAPSWSSIVGYWKLNEGAGSSAIVDSGPVGTHSGTPNGGVAFGGYGKLNKTGVFNGSGGQIPISGISGSTLGSGDFTISFWMNSTQLYNWQTVLSMGEGCNSTPRIDVGTVGGSGQPFFEVGDGTNYNRVYGNTDVIDGKWHLITSTRSGVNIDIYIDGALSATTTTVNQSTWTNALVVSTDTSPLTLGISNCSAYYGGSLDEVAIWKGVALSGAAISTIYQHQAAARSGSFISRVIDAKLTSSLWTSLSWITTLPFFKALPDNGVSEIQANYSSLASSTLMNQVMGLWHLDETTSGGGGAGKDFQDSSGLNHWGALNGGVTPGVSGKFNNAANFNGSGSSIKITNTYSSVDAFTTSAWVNGATATYNTISSTDAYRLFISGGQINFLSWDGTTQNSYVAATIPSSGWHHVAVSRAAGGATTNLYVDGILVATGSTPHWATTFTYFSIGENLNATGGTDYFVGNLDEVAMWGRALSTAEVQQLFQRGASRLKFQVKSCATATCTDGSWSGPDGTSATYFTEIDNAAGYNKIANVPTGSVNTTNPALTFANFLNPPAANRYFQYRTIFESDAQLVALMPELKSTTIAPNHYDSTSPTVVSQVGLSAQVLTSFIQTLGAGGCSGVTYNLGIGTSSATATWYWWSSSTNSWTVAGGLTATSTSAASINANLVTFPVPGTSSVYVKAFLNSNGSNACQLQELQLNGHS